jgi:peptidoglycan hydrolase-like protein with peptidoglycan-binding domain
VRFSPAPGMSRNLLNPSDVRAVQEQLHSLGYYRYPPEGIWGLESRKALRDFKIANGLPSDEEWDGAVERALARTRATPAATLPAKGDATHNRVSLGTCRVRPPS